MNLEQYKKLWSWSKGHRLFIWLNMCLSIVGYSCQLIVPFTIGIAVNAMVPHHVDMNRVSFYLVLSGGLYIASFVLLWIASMCAQSFASEMVMILRNRAFDTLTKMPISYLDRHPIGEIMTRFSNDGDFVFDALNQVLNQLFSFIIIVSISFLFMLSINIPMTLIVIFMTPIIFLISKKVSTLSVRQFRKQQHLSAKMNGAVEEFLEQQRLIIAYNYQERATKVFEEMNSELNDVGMKAQFYSALTNPTTRVVNNFTYVFLGIGGAIAIIHSGMSIGALTSFFSYSLLFSKPFNEISSVFSQILAGQTSLKRMFDLIEHEVEVEEYSFHEEDIAKFGNVVFDHLSFGYEKNKTIIEDFSAVVKEKSKIAIVGPTGAGKSTIINLLMRFYDVDKGTIFIDDKNYQHINRNALRLSFGIVLQDTWLFEGTVAENIAYGRPDATPKEIIAAAKEANCHEFIMNLNDGYDSVIHQGSTNISLGQRQLLTIARMILMRPTILILDEATSNIDGLSEQKIQATFKEIMKDHTTFYVAHRLTSVTDADMILVMKDGKIIEQGKHRKLMNDKGFYYHLFMSQFQEI